MQQDGEAPSRDGPHCRAQCPDTSFPINKPAGTRRHWESNPLPSALESNALPRDHRRLHMQAAFFHTDHVTSLPAVPLFYFASRCSAFMSVTLQAGHSCFPRKERRSICNVNFSCIAYAIVIECLFVCSDLTWPVASGHPLPANTYSRISWTLKGANASRKQTLPDQENTAVVLATVGMRMPNSISLHAYPWVFAMSCQAKIYFPLLLSKRT